jgi:hypothetical protein
MPYIYWIQNARTKYETNLFTSILKYTPKAIYIQGDDSYQISHNVRRFVREGEYPILVDSPYRVLPYNPVDILLSAPESRLFSGIPTLKIFHVELQILNVDKPATKELILILGHDADDLALLLAKSNGRIRTSSTSKGNGRTIVCTQYLTLDTLIADAKVNGYHHVLILREAQI